MKDEQLKSKVVNYDIIEKELFSIQTVTNKLNYLKSYHEKIKKDKLYNSSTDNLPAIIKSLESKHFKDCHTNPEFTYWFLKYNAQQMFESYKLTKKFKDRFYGKHKLNFIKKELKKINDIETKAATLDIEDKINIDAFSKPIGYLHLFKNDNVDFFINEIEYLRVTDNSFYKKHPTPFNYKTYGPEVKAYFKHLLLKPFLKNELALIEKETRQQNKEKSKYSLKAIKIAYFCLGEESITKDNYLEILEKYSDSRSDKILQKPIFKSNQLTSLTENKPADTKHLNSLKSAERLLSGIKDNQALKSISQIISTFEANYKNHYE